MTANRSFFAADLTVTGSVTGAGHLQIDGRVDGDVAVGAVAVGASGSLSGTVQAVRADIAGTISGALRAAAVSVADGGALSGVVEYERLAVAAGGSFEAECRPTTAPALAPERAAAHGPRPVLGHLVPG